MASCKPNENFGQDTRRALMRPSALPSIVPSDSVAPLPASHSSTRPSQPAVEKRPVGAPAASVNTCVYPLLLQDRMIENQHLALCVAWLSAWMSCLMWHVFLRGKFEGRSLQTTLMQSQHALQNELRNRFLTCSMMRGSTHGL